VESDKDVIGSVLLQELPCGLVSEDLRSGILEAVANKAIGEGHIEVDGNDLSGVRGMNSSASVPDAQCRTQGFIDLMAADSKVVEERKGGKGRQGESPSSGPGPGLVSKHPSAEIGC